MSEQDHGQSIEFGVYLEEQPQASEEVSEGCRMAVAFVEDSTWHEVRTRVAEIGLKGGKKEILWWNLTPPCIQN